MGQRSLRKYLYDIPKNMRSFIDDFVGVSRKSVGINIAECDKIITFSYGKQIS